MLETEASGPVIVVRLAHGKVNALDHELCGAIGDTFGRLSQRSDVSAVVLTGSGASFSAGVDLRRITRDGPGYAGDLLRLLDETFLAIFRFDKPVVAALNGHALAGGYVMACACDQRFLATGAAQVGVPELRAGVPFPTVAIEILRHAVGARAQQLVLTGHRFGGARAVELGLVDGIVDADVLVAHAVDVAADLSQRIPPAAYALSKQQLRHVTLERIASGQSRFESRVNEQWTRPNAGAWIEGYFTRLAEGTGR